MQRGVFSDLFDTVRTESSEEVAAQATLQSLILHPCGAKLSVTHGIDSSVLLNQCCDSVEFLQLVTYGRIRFARWPDGKGIREAFDTALSLPPDKYLLSAWPELQYDRDLRAHTREVWSGEREHSGNDYIDGRLERLSKLVSAIETYEKGLSFTDIFIEDKRDNTLAELIRSANDWPIVKHSSETKRTVAALENFSGNNSRSQLYDYVKLLDISDNERDLVLDIIDECYSISVAKSLRARLHTSSRRTGKSCLPSNFTNGNPSNIKTGKIPGNIPTDCKIQWKDIVNVLPVIRSEQELNKFECISSYKKLLSGIQKEQGAQVRFVVTKIGFTVASAVPTVTIPALVAAAVCWTVDFDGALGVLSRETILGLVRSHPYLNGAAGLLSGCLGHLWTNEAIDNYEHKQTDKATNAFSGFLENSE